MTVLSRNPALFVNAYPLLRSQPGLRYVKGDIRSFEFLSKRYDYIIHAASQYSDETIKILDKGRLVQ